MPFPPDWPRTDIEVVAQEADVAMHEALEVVVRDLNRKADEAWDALDGSKHAVYATAANRLRKLMRLGRDLV